MAEIQAGVYRHYKGLDYQVFEVARHSETEEVLVSYRCLYGDYGWWVRPFDMFCEAVVVEGVERPRFEYVKAFDPSDYKEAPSLQALVASRGQA